MSLLTKEQLKEILLIIEEEVNVEWPCSMMELLHEWNKKQTGIQVNVDWDIQAELVLAPQKREPAQTAREMYQRGYAKAKDDLKREQDVVIQKLTEHLERVLFAWGMGRPLSEENDLYMNAHYYLKGLKDDAND